MKKITVLFTALILVGCTYTGQPVSEYFEDPTNILRDPHYTDYQKQKDDLERKYLYKEINYAEYIEQKQAVDDKYSGEVQSRRDIIESHR